MAGDLAAYDYVGLAALLRPRLEADGRGWRACAAEIGVTSPDLSRVCAGQGVSAAKVIAICDWLGLSFRAFYRPAAPPQALAGMFHEKSTETEGRAHAA